MRFLSFLLLTTALLSSCAHLSSSKPASAKIDERCPASARTGTNERCESALVPHLDYALGNEGAPNAQLQFGAESEYVAEESGALLNIYIPETEITGIQPDEWLKMPLTKKIEIIEKYQKKIFPYRQPGRIHLQTEDAKLRNFLPDSLVYDSTHFEIVLKPMNSVSTLIEDLRYAEKVLGAGSLQLTFSTPRKNFETKEEKDQFYREQLGHLNYANERDTLEKLDSGFQKYSQSPDAHSAASFNHPFLGPMTKIKQEKLKKWIRLLADGKKLNKGHRDELSFEVSSSKFLGGVSFRPDVAQDQNRLAYEIRQCHKSLQCIEQIIQREIQFLKTGYSYFTKFAEIEAFDNKVTFDQMDSPLKDFLKDLFPKFRDYRIVSTQMYRNFSYPFRDWSFFTSTDKALSQSVSKAQKKYLRTLEKISASYAAEKIDRDQAIIQVMAALSAFPSESGLLEALRKIEKDYRSSNP